MQQRQLPASHRSRIISVGLLLALISLPGMAATPVKLDPYRAQFWTESPPMAPGSTRIFLSLQQSDGRPLLNAAVSVLAAMPGMPMGERRERAEPAPGRPGIYAATVHLAMAGVHRVTVRVAGADGEAMGGLTLRALPRNGAAGPITGGSFWAPAGWILLGLLLVFILYRLRRTGVRISREALTSRSTIAALLIIMIAAVASGAAVRALQRPGMMSLLGALTSDMSRMPAPPGAVPVALADVDQAPVQASVRYTGSAASYLEQEIFPRVSGWITWMPFYAGDSIRRGQLLIKLDTRELESRVQEREADRAMAEQMKTVAELEYRQFLASAAESRAGVRSREGGLDEARRMVSRNKAMVKESQAALAEAQAEVRSLQADLRAAGQERLSAEAMLESGRAAQPETEAMLAGMKADQAYWTRQIARLKVLFNEGAVSGEEFQRDEAAFLSAASKVRQAAARLSAVKGDIRAAEFALARAAAMEESAQSRLDQAASRVEGAQAKVEQAESEVAASAARVRMAESDLDAARENARALQAMAAAGAAKIRQAQAGIRGAGAGLTTARVVRGYTEIRSLIDGVVLERLISPGVLVSPGQAILKIAQIQPIRLQASVASTDLTRVRPGYRVTARSTDGGAEIGTARVTSITPALDAAARTGTVEAIFPNRPLRFLPGQYVQMEIAAGRSRRTLRVPSAAIRWQSSPSSRILSFRQTPYVWVAEPAVEKNSYTARRANVRTGAGDGRYTEILEGLREGQKVVVRGYERLQHGDPMVAVLWGPGGPETLPPSEGTPPGLPGHEGHGSRPGEGAPPHTGRNHAFGGG